MKTMDLTPSWETAVGIYCDILSNPHASTEARAQAETDLIKLARHVDQQQAKENAK
jgi:hypothetical protein